MAAYQYVYVMKNLTKAYPGGREVFKGITLSFLPTAKIGVLGPNGAGKSTLMRIMSGQDKDFGGEAWGGRGQGGLSAAGTAARPQYDGG
jgi:ATPase subunit of ABC transporter with duplicated ATPase domains